MRQLSRAQRTKVVAALVEGNSIRGTVRLTAIAKNTIVKLLVDLGAACSKCQNERIRGIRARRVQCDEIWSFVGSKEKHTSAEKKAEGCGDCWTWTALDADTKLMISFRLSVATHEGIVYPSEEGARGYCESHDTDPVQVGRGWLAKNRNTRRGPIPTNAGDVIISRLHQLFRVWTVTPDGNTPPSEFWNRTDAEREARTLARNGNGRLFWLQSNGEWAEISN